MKENVVYYRCWVICEWLVGFLLVSTALVAPWFFGGTSFKAYFWITIAGWVIGLFSFLGYFFNRAFIVCIGSKWPGFFGGWFSLVCAGVALINLYVAISTVNFRSLLKYTFATGSIQATGVEIEYFEFIPWLPHTYDRDLTLRALAKYLALTFIFLSTRWWVLSASKNRGRKSLSLAVFPNIRIQILLWAISINSAILGLVGIVQRLDSNNMLLGFYDQYTNRSGGSFGPYPYQSNAAQYLNLMWPIMVAFWWVLRQRSLRTSLSDRRLGGDPHILLVVLIVLVAGSVIMTRSKGGVFVLLGLLVCVSVVVIFKERSSRTLTFGVVSSGLLVLLLGGWLGGQEIIDRFSNIDLVNLSGRRLLYEDTEKMAKDFLFFGSGAETFAPLYFFYRQVNPNWDAYAHNDYLETLVTFGSVGMVIIVLTFILIWLVPLFGDGIPAPKEFIVLIALSMAGIMTHARFDLPFQIYSLHLEFVILCGLVTCLKLEKN